MRTGAALAAMDPHKNVEKDNKIAPPSSVMNSRLLARNSIRKRFGINCALVSSTPVRSAHGNSFDHLVGAGEQHRFVSLTRSSMLLDWLAIAVRSLVGRYEMLGQ